MHSENKIFYFGIASRYRCEVIFLSQKQASVNSSRCSTKFFEESCTYDENLKLFAVFSAHSFSMLLCSWSFPTGNNLIGQKILFFVTSSTGPKVSVISAH